VVERDALEDRDGGPDAAHCAPRGALGHASGPAGQDDGAPFLPRRREPVARRAVCRVPRLRHQLTQVVCRRHPADRVRQLAVVENCLQVVAVGDLCDPFARQPGVEQDEVDAEEVRGIQRQHELHPVRGEQPDPRTGRQPPAAQHPRQPVAEVDGLAVGVGSPLVD